MKLENNWRYKSLQDLEKDYWNKAAYGSHLVTRCHELRTIPLNEFTTEDLRIMIGQEIGLTWLIPLALEKLKENIFAEGNFYPGDLLTNVTKVDLRFWDINSELHEELKELLAANREIIEEEGLKINWYK